jgi:hypothetical protein
MLAVEGRTFGALGAAQGRKDEYENRHEDVQAHGDGAEEEE